MPATETLRRVVRIAPAWNKRHTDPSKDYGVGAVTIYMALVGPKGAMSTRFSTGMYLPEVRRDWRDRAEGLSYDPTAPMGLGVDYHSTESRFEGQRENACDLLPGGRCYSDGSALAGDAMLDVLLRQGEDGVWRELEDRYRSRFGGDNNGD